jgi:hypothetical protein
MMDDVGLFAASDGERCSLHRDRALFALGSLIDPHEREVEPAFDGTGYEEAIRIELEGFLCKRRRCSGEEIVGCHLIVELGGCLARDFDRVEHMVVR